MSTIKVLGIEIPILSFNKNQRQMKNEKLSRILGRDVQVGEKLSDADMQLILAAVPDADGGTPPATPPANNTPPANPPAEESEEEETDAVNADVMGAIQGLTTSIQGLTNKITGIEKRMDVLEGKKPAAADAVVAPNNPAANTGGEKKYSWDDPESPLNKKIDQDLGPIGK